MLEDLVVIESNFMKATQMNMSEKEIERLARVRTKRRGSVMTKVMYEAEGLLEAEPINND